MLIETLREFCTLAKILNYTKAASELHLSQSTLSRHIKLLETKLGFPLIINTGSALSISEPGSLFLNTAFNIIKDYDKTVKQCRELAESLKDRIVVHDPTYKDSACMMYVRRIGRFRNSHPEVEIKFSELRYRTPKAELLESNIDLILEYRFGDDDRILSEYMQDGLEAALFCESPLIAWISKKSSLSHGECLSLGDVKDMSLMTIYDSFSPTRRALGELFSAHGYEARFVNRAFTHLIDFYMSPLPDNSLYLFPSGLESNSMLVSREDMAFVPVKDVSLKVFLVFGAKDRTPFLDQLIDELCSSDGQLVSWPLT